MDIKKLVESPNIAELLDDKKLAGIGAEAQRGYEEDKESRASWEEWYAESLKLALQVMEEKTTPWPKCSNVKFPLLTIAALHFHARAYPALLSMASPVQCRVHFADPGGIKAARAERISRHMSYQVLEEDESWEEHHDRMLISLPIVGTAFKKSYFDPVRKINRSELVLARDLVVNYWTKDLKTAPRATHILYFQKNDILERVRRGIYLDIPFTPTQVPTDVITEARDETQKHYPGAIDGASPKELLEQHCWLDLDEDGYEEPYIVTVCDGKVLRIVANYFEETITFNDRKEVICIEPGEWFTKYGFIPSPDGGFYDIGLGLLLGPLNESVNTMINQLIDSGTMNNLQAGILGRGVKFKGGVYTFVPGEWKRSESSGEDLAKGVYPLPTKEPSAVLLQLLTFLVGYGERVAGATETQVGENPGQNTPAETMRTMNENGQRIFNGIYKRIWRSMKAEFRKLFKLNSLYFELSRDFKEMTSGERPFIGTRDYDATDVDIRPSADPNIVSESERERLAMMVMQNALQIPGHKLYESVKRAYETLKVPDIEEVFPDPQGPNAIPQGPTIEQQKLQLEQQKLQLQAQEMQMNQQTAAIELQNEAQLNAAKIMELQAKAILALEEAEGINTGHEIAMIQNQIAAAKNHQESLLRTIEIMRGHKDGSGQVGVAKTPTNKAFFGPPAGTEDGTNGGMGGKGVPERGRQREGAR